MFRRASNGQFTSTDAQYLMRISVCFSLNSVILPQARDRSWIEDSYQGNVSVKSKLQHAPPGQTPGNLTFLKIFVQIPPYPGQNAVQMPHTRVHSGDQMPPPRRHFTGTKMTEGRRKRLQLSKKVFINITKTEKHYVYVSKVSCKAAEIATTS